MTVPFNRPTRVGHALRYVADAVARGELAGDGPYSRRCEAKLAAATGGRRVLLTTSCTHALEMAALLLGLGPPDEVVVPAFTFVSTANAFVLRGATPVFGDVRADTLNLDERKLEGRITARTRAIVVMHYAGVACDMDAILEIAERRGLPVVEDNAHGLGGSWRGRPLGSLGALAALSFHESKNITSGEGGAIVVNDRALWARAEVVREKGTNRSRFRRGELERYGWVDLGSSWLPSELAAAYLFGQLERAPRIQARRATLWRRYSEELGPWAERTGARLPVVPEGCGSAWHSFHLRLPSRRVRDRLHQHLRARGIASAFHYPPLNRSPMARRFGPPQPCPVAEEASARLLRLPFYTDLSAAERAAVVAAVTSFAAR